jgi:hypothetical protein
MATLLKVLINLADIKSAGGVALRVGIQAGEILAGFFVRLRLDLPLIGRAAVWRATPRSQATDAKIIFEVDRPKGFAERYAPTPGSGTFCSALSPGT